ncbi:CapA family protein [Traorella massiliensis]|uniref:CapA family protein n=1 Tax=Traorella massiliensis TaxID=1903263 RepID=UPI0023571C61|nr:CapA family protein [Traorella massiliensis]
MKKLFVLLSLFLFVGCAEQKPQEPSVDAPVEEPVVEEKEDSVVSFMAVGDNLIHGAIYMNAYAKYGSYEFDDIYSEIKYFVESKDVAYINQETILGGTELGLSHYPMFNSPQEIGVAVANAGFDWIASCSNHSMDKFEDGIISDLNFWDQYPDIVTTGLNRSFEEQQTNKYIERNGVKFGVLGYTYGTNGIEIPEGKEYLVNLYSKERIKEDIERLEGTCDSILVSMHWGDEYSTTPNAEQQELAQYMADLGVDVIIGEHPHVIQPMDWIEGKDGNQTLVIYSLGNFLSSQDEAFNMLGGCASFDIRKDGNTGETTVENVKWYPVVNHISYGDYMAGTRDYRVYLLKDYTDELASQHRLGITRQYFIDKTEEVMNDKFEIVY